MRFLIPALITVMFSVPMAAGAATMTTDCSLDAPDVTGSVSPSIACYVLPDAPPNLDADFETDTGDSLTFLEKDDGTFGGGSEILLTGDSLSGTWEILNFVAGDIYAILFKDGRNAEPSSQVMFYVDEASGTYESPFFLTEDGTTSKDISFTALFSVDDGSTTRVDVIPLPAGIWLLLTGAGGFGALRVMQRRKSSAVK